MTLEDSGDHRTKVCEDRIPTLPKPNEVIQENNKNKLKSTNTDAYKMKKRNYVIYNNFVYKNDISKRIAMKENRFYNYCFLSVFISFIFGLAIGVSIVSSKSQTSSQSFQRKLLKINPTKDGHSRSLNSLKFSDKNSFENNDLDRYATVSFTGAVDSNKYKMDIYPKSLTENMKEILKDNKAAQKHSISSINKTVHVPSGNTVLYDNVFWGPEVENSMPQGYGENSAEVWEKYVEQSEVAKMEPGCGRMQNRLVTFKDGVQACVRYRQNTDQIQGEIFSFYVARLLNLTNLAPSVVKVVDLKDKLWQSVSNDIVTAQWNTNRAVVLTQYIPSLDSAFIPEIFKPANRHLNKNDVLKMSLKEKEVKDSKQLLLNKIKTKTKNKEMDEKFDYVDAKLNKKTTDLFVELAQWSDLIIFDYLTANLDRIVNNLFNYQWNINIMDGPAHNLARKMDSGLLLFLDNESGLLHGYRLLKKYNSYHSLMLDNLCVFRKRTVDALKRLKQLSVGSAISDMFHKKNNAVIRDILPPLPEKNSKILHERICKVLSQIENCQQSFANR